MKVHVLAAALLALPILPAGGVAQSSALRVRVSPEMASCVQAALGPAVAVEAGDPRITEGADLIVGDEGLLTRTLEGGHADDRWALRVVGDVIAAPVGRSARFDEARGMVARLAGSGARQALARCAGALHADGVTRAGDAFVAGSARYATAVADWWLPVCSQQQNRATDPNEALGAPNAVNLGARGQADYRGMMSLGQGGWVVVDMGQMISNRPGHDVRVHQFTSNEPVSLYAGENATGPFTLVAFRRHCGERAPGAPANRGYCDFDLAEGGLASARYLRIEDGELYPCLRGTTTDEGADIDAVELLNP